MLFLEGIERFNCFGLNNKQVKILSCNMTYETIIVYQQ